MKQNEWTKSSRCAADSPQCVEVKQSPNGTVVVRDRDGDKVFFAPEEWAPFVEGVKAGEFDL